MNSIIGFSLFCTLSSQKIETALTVQREALFFHSHLQYRSIKIGASQLELWGRNELSERVHFLPNGALLVLIGSPLGGTTLLEAGTKILNTQNPDEFEIPWDGRVILLMISADGQRWTIWNDWLGSMPVFHSLIEGGRAASTLEPVVVAAGGFTPDNIFLPGLLSLLINGHFFSDWSLYKNMHVIPPDSMMKWEDEQFQFKRKWTVKPTQDRWETGWDDLVDEMHELSHRAVSDVLKQQDAWTLPLSSGLDSRLIAAVGADVGANMYSYAWGEPHTTDVIYSREVARVLGLPWKHITMRKDFLLEYTKHWADWFGSGMHFHGMYQMCFLDAIKAERSGPVLSGFLGDVLTGDSIVDAASHHSVLGKQQLETKWYSHWLSEEVKSIMNIPVEAALEANAEEIKKQIELVPGARFQQLQFLELWSRQRFFTYFQSTLADYWRGVATPFLNRNYARFCLSLPRAVLDNRRLLGDVFRRYYGRLAVIPGTYANEPFIVTGRYLLRRRVATQIPFSIHKGLLGGFENIQLRMDMLGMRTAGKKSLWPIYDTWEQLGEWLDVRQIEQAYHDVMNNLDDIRPLRKLQSIQALAYRLKK